MNTTLCHFSNYHKYVKNKMNRIDDADDTLVTLYGLRGQGCSDLFLSLSASPPPPMFRTIT